MTARLLSSCNTFHAPCRLRQLSLFRYLSAKPPVANADNKAFTNTLLLPKTTFPLRPDLKETEATYRKATCDSLYKWQWKNAEGPVFVLHDGPPYANGDLHMGHALNKILKDIINRFHLSRGRKVHYVPGWDCHGLPIENKALKELKRSALETPASVIRKAARETAEREIASQKEQFRHLAVMADWDSEAGTYRTLDRHYEIRQLRIFHAMVQKGLIYRQYRPVHYSPSSHSALAEAELEYKDDHVSHSVYVTFDLDSDSLPTGSPLQTLQGIERNVKLLVWTTTPWTLTANMGIAVHEDMIYDIIKRKDAEGNEDVLIVAHDRLEALSSFLGEINVIGSLTGKELIGLSYKHIFPSSTTQSLKVIGASHVTALSGTGLVHCAPAHGHEDYEAFHSLGLLKPGLDGGNIMCHVNAKGQFAADVVDVVGTAFAEKLIGKEVLGDGNKAMVALLKELNRVLKIERIKHRYPYDWKTNEPIIVTATSQWFANLALIKNNAIDALRKVTYLPEISENRLEAFVESRSEWCISRQRVWGVPIPALRHIETGKVTLEPDVLEYIINALESKNLDWWESPIEELIPPWLLEEGKTAAETWERGKDTMDVWFDSGSSWSMLAEMGVSRDRVGSPSPYPQTGRTHDADLCLEGSDQHRGWFQSQLLTAIGANPPGEPEVSPYASLITHGMVLDEKGKKMSKSLGNIINPMTIIHASKDKKQPAYGVDVLRLWAATVDYWRDMSIGPTVISQAAESLRKLRNTARFCLANMGDPKLLETMERVPKEQMNMMDRYVMHELYMLEKNAVENYSEYVFPKVISSLHNFANITMSSLYFDVTKDCLYANSIHSRERRAVVTVLEQVLGTLTRIMAPVLPYLAEEIHATWKADNKSIFMTPWTLLSDEWKDDQLAREMSKLFVVRDTVLSLLEQARRDKHIKSALEAEVQITYPKDAATEELPSILRREENHLKTLFIVSDVTLSEDGLVHPEKFDWSYSKTLDPQDHELSKRVSSALTAPISIRVVPAARHKCPRCWTFTREEDHQLCSRCTDVVKTDHAI